MAMDDVAVALDEPEVKGLPTRRPDEEPEEALTPPTGEEMAEELPEEAAPVVDEAEEAPLAGLEPAGPEEDPAILVDMEEAAEGARED